MLIPMNKERRIEKLCKFMEHCTSDEVVSALKRSGKYKPIIHSRVNVALDFIRQGLIDSVIDHIKLLYKDIELQDRTNLHEEDTYRIHIMCNVTPQTLLAIGITKALEQGE